MMTTITIANTKNISFRNKILVETNCLQMKIIESIKKSNPSLFYIYFIIVMFFTSFTLKGQQIKYINSDSLRVVRGYSHAVMFTDLGIVKTSGIIGTNKAGVLVNSTPREQIKQTFYNLTQILGASGTEVESIDEIETFLTDSIYFKDYVQERIEFFKGKKEPPISKTYYIKGLINPDAIVEINVTATIKQRPLLQGSTLFVTAILEAKDGHSQIVYELLRKNIGPSRNEKGCIQYNLFQSAQNKNLFILHEKWLNQDAFDLHFKMPYMIEVSKNLKDILKSSTINIMDEIKE